MAAFGLFAGTIGAPAEAGPGAAAAVGVWPGIGWFSALLQPLTAIAVSPMADNVRAIDRMVSLPLCAELINPATLLSLRSRGMR
jgi:hypothetical protein